MLATPSGVGAPSSGKSLIRHCQELEVKSCTASTSDIDFERSKEKKNIVLNFAFPLVILNPLDKKPFFNILTMSCPLFRLAVV